MCGKGKIEIECVCVDVGDLECVKMCVGERESERVRNDCQQIG